MVLRRGNPFVYLRDVIERVSTHPARRVLELTPREWKRLRLGAGAQAPPERRISYNKAPPPAGLVDPNLRIAWYLRPPSSLSAARGRRWS
jgi:hypothetical protein